MTLEEIPGAFAFAFAFSSLALREASDLPSGLVRLESPPLLLRRSVSPVDVLTGLIDGKPVKLRVIGKNFIIVIR